MFNYKGVGIVFLRKRIQSAKKEAELLDLLNEEEKLLYRRTVDVSWVPMAFVSKLFLLTGQFCYPGLPKTEQLHKIGFELAVSSVNRVYALIFKILSPIMLMEKAATLWRTYHSGGQVTVADKMANRCSFVLSGYADLPEDFAEATSGYIASFIEQTGATHCRVTIVKKKDQWIWQLQWTPK